MSGLNYPYVFRCSGCSDRLEITRTDALGVSSTPDSLDAVTQALHQKHRWRHDSGRLFCPDCDPEPVEAT